MDNRKGLERLSLFGGYQCVFCGGVADTTDHTPPKCLLERPYPADLMTVPACENCNSGFSRDEAFLKAVLAHVSFEEDLIQSKRDGDVARAIGRMRVFEALTLLYDFVASYNPDGPFIKIGRFDSNYDDPDEDHCEDCEDYHSPYCICECSHNGAWSCQDCGSYRTEYCYTECGYNVPGFSYVSPCDDCEETGQHCFLECPHNGEWQVKSPCNECDKTDCDGCDHAARKAELVATKRPTAAS